MSGFFKNQLGKFFNKYRAITEKKGADFFLILNPAQKP